MSSPTCGSSTNTISPNSDCANSVIPMRTLPSSSFTHSCSFEYLSSFGKLIGTPPAYKYIQHKCYIIQAELQDDLPCPSFFKFIFFEADGDSFSISHNWSFNQHSIRRK